MTGTCCKEKKKIKRKPTRINRGWVVIGTYLTRALGIIHVEMRENAEESGRKPVREQHLLLQEHLCLESALLEGNWGGGTEQRESPD